jgi:hypothetical protein
VNAVFLEDTYKIHLAPKLNLTLEPEYKDIGNIPDPNNAVCACAMPANTFIGQIKMYNKLVK